MISPLDTHIAYFGGSVNTAALEAITKLSRAGFDVVCVDHSPLEAPALYDANITFVSDRLDVLESSDIIITSLKSSDDVEDLYLGEKGLIEFAPPGTYFIDLSFTSERIAREIQAMAAVSELDVIDAPVIHLGQAQKTICFVGGTPVARDLLGPIFPYIAEIIRFEQEAGSGQRALAMAILEAAGTIMGLVEALALARICELDSKPAIDTLAISAGASRMLVDYSPNIIEMDFKTSMNVQDFLGALEAALLTVEDRGLTTPMAEIAYQLYKLLDTVGGQEMDISALSLLYANEELCSKYGLDWALAEDIAHDREMFFSEEFEDFLNSLRTDDNKNGPAGGENGLGPDEFFPRGSGLFSKN